MIIFHSKLDPACQPCFRFWRSERPADCGGVLYPIFVNEAVQLFCPLGSSLRFPRAVAASSAFPFLLSPISLLNYAKPAGYEISEKTDNPAKIDKKESPPGRKTVGFKTATLSLDNYSFETIEMFKELVGQRIKAQKALKDCQQRINQNCSNKYTIESLAGGDMKLYVVDLTFDDIPLESPAPAIKGRNYYNQLPTTFYFPNDQVDNLITVGGWLLEENPDFKPFSKEYQP